MHDYFKTVEYATQDVSFVDFLDFDDMDLESINTTVASVAVSALMRNKVTPVALQYLNALAQVQVQVTPDHHPKRCLNFTRLLTK